MGAKRHGLTWKRLDLHVHTPASKDYTGPKLSPKEFVESAIARGVDGVAITDHNCADWVDEVSAAASGSPLAVFPGVEISTGSGMGGVHVIAIFERGTSRKAIEGLLARLDFPSEAYGRLDISSKKTALEVCEEICRSGGLAVLAHADSSKGALNEMRGQQRIDLLNSSAVCAVEANDAEKIGKLLDGTDEAFQRKLAVYRSSDNPNPTGTGGHSVDGVGSKHTYFKTDGLSLEALAQCFSDPDVRILPDTGDLADLDRSYPRVVSLETTRGFLSDQVFYFHEGLNSIIGGKGVGKSLLVEFIRFALDQPSTVRDIRDDMESKLLRQLGIGGVVKLVVELDGGGLLEIRRTYDSKSNPIEAKFQPSGVSFGGRVHEIFPVLAYSQTETIAIARDESAQLALIDSFIDLGSLRHRSAELRAELSRSARALIDARQSALQREQHEAELATLSQQIAQLDAALSSTRHQEITGLRPKTDCFATLSDRAAHLAETCEALISDLEDCDDLQLTETLLQDIALVALRDELASETQRMLSIARDLSSQAEALRLKTTNQSAEWLAHVANCEAEYQTWLSEQGGNFGELNARRVALVDHRAQVEKSLEVARSAAERLSSLEHERTQLLDEVEAVGQTIFEERKRKFAEISEMSGGRLRLELVRNGSRRSFAQTLNQLKKGSNLHDATMEAISATFTPRQFVRIVMEDDWKAIVSAAEIPEASAKKLLAFVGAKNDLMPLLEVEHAELVFDAPRIQYKKEDGEYYDLTELSIGQKCTALLIIALVEGNRPIMIDQPEDALDIPSVYEDVTLQLRSKKSQRQFIVTTHNPTVAVASDSDQFHVLKASATSAKIAARGAMERPAVKIEVIQHLEGGPLPFALKTRKYAGGLPEK